MKDQQPDATTDEQYEFASSAWVDMFRNVFVCGLAERDLEGIDFTASEEFLDPPAHLLSGDNQTIGFYYRIRAGELEVSDRPLPESETTVKTVVDYDTALPFARRSVDENARLSGKSVAERVEDWSSQGLLKMTGKFEQVPAVVRDLHIHDRLSARTR
jgi:hypothetical protein